MRLGDPILYSDGEAQREFAALIPISAKRDDPYSFNEALLQELIDKSPNILPIRDYLSSSTALFSLCREIQVELGGGAQGFIDNLLVTNDGFLVIVETKLYRNPEAIREVIAQTLQYGMAIGQMSVLELEFRIKRAEHSALKNEESIRDCVGRLASDGPLADDFDEAFERHLRQGEILLLIASDGIRIGVERVTHWLNEQGNSSPFKFGLVELKFYAFADRQRLVVPRTVLKTREVSRHVVVVDIQPSTEVSITARVTDEYQSTIGGKMQESRPVKAASTPLTKGTLLQLLTPTERQAASRVIEQLEILRFEPQGTGSTLKYGFTSDNGDFHSLVSLDKSGVWVCPLKMDRDLLGPDGLLGLREEANQFALFYRDDQLSKPDSMGCAVKYPQLETSAASFAAFLDEYRSKITRLLEAKSDT